MAKMKSSTKRSGKSRAPKSGESRTEVPPQITAAAPAGHACPIAAFGASAGGLEAFTALLAHLPVDLGMSLIFIQHLDPKHSSALSELLTRATGLTVVEAKDRMPVA